MRKQLRQCAAFVYTGRHDITIGRIVEEEPQAQVTVFLLKPIGGLLRQPAKG